MLSPSAVPCGLNSALWNVSLSDLLLTADHGDNDLRLVGWQVMKGKASAAPMNIPKMMQEVEQEFLENEKSLVDHVDQLFKNFATKLNHELEVIPFPSEQIHSLLEINQLQMKLQRYYEEEALVEIWKGKLAPVLHPNSDLTVANIRAWLQDLNNRDQIRQIKELNLYGFKVLPPEIHTLTALKRFRLYASRLNSLPESFGNLTALRELWLKNNQLSSLPESFGNLTVLRDLTLENNQLSSLPESFCNLTALEKLYLSNNQLSSLSESIGSLTTLETLNLCNNRLSSLPESFGNLAGLLIFSLSNNQLSSLPERFGNLTSLQLLKLDNNRLCSLPGSFGNLTALRWLWLDNNRLCSLPKSFGNLTALSDPKLDGNPLLFVSNKKLLKRRLRPLEFLNHQTHFLSYPFETPLGKLFCALMRNESGMVKDLFQQLPKQIREPVIVNVQEELRTLQDQSDLCMASSPMACSSSFSVQQVEDDLNLFEDLSLLGRVICKELDESFERLNEKEKNAVYLQISKLKNHEEDLEWGREHAFDDMALFIEAYTLVMETSKAFPLKHLIEFSTTLAPEPKKKRTL